MPFARGPDYGKKVHAHRTHSIECIDAAVTFQNVVLIFITKCACFTVTVTVTVTITVTILLVSLVVSSRNYLE